MTKRDVFAKLLHLMISKRYSVKPTLASLNYLLDRAPSVIELESNAILHIRTLLFQQSAEKTKKYPKLILYLLQNYNKLSIRDVQAMNLPDIPLQEQQQKLNTFLLESAVFLAVHFRFEIDINSNALNNAPTIEQGILECMNLVEKVQKSGLRHSKQISFQTAKIDATKGALWELVLYLWLVQCLCQQKRLPQETLAQQIRIVALQRCLFKKKMRRPDLLASNVTQSHSDT